MNEAGHPNRRTFLRLSGTVLSGSMLAGLSVPYVHAGESARLKLGLVGCGGRGTGAAANALAPECNKDAVLWAMADLFPQHLEASLKNLTTMFQDRVQVPPERRFTGFDGYRGVIDACDVVLVCTPPRFTAKITLEAVRAKRHVFFEITGAVDVPTVQMILEADELSRKNGTSLLDGHVYRAHLARREAVQRMLDGQIGQITAIQCDYMRTWYRPMHHKPEWSELEYQIRNWNWFNWLNGGHVGNTLSHNLDSALWALGDQVLPEAAYGMGGRSTHIHPSRGTSYDHESVVYEFPNGLMLYGFIRNADNCFNSNRDIYHGTKGRCYYRAFSAPQITDLKGNVIWRADEALAQKSAYEQEQIELLESVRSGKPIHRGKILANCAMMCVLGQLAVFTGQRVTWKEAVDSKFAFLPVGDITWQTEPPVKPGPDGLYPVPVPGVTTIQTPLAGLAPLNGIPERA
ncbi:MAG: Gfo/Idh/MocA family oxidoreductase [Thermoguttaceae bacterium]|nr:Gfo/Idh/MocA family oxidoreductase [Thermoguttaceae bacterium]MDW8036675.1 Gfo/Idh/MocA family oxidoreductase [Thermoguttaceae bacterium]